MDDYLHRDAMLAQLARERTAHMLGQARVALAMENAGVRSDGERRRKRRARIARFLKELAMRLAPPIVPDARRTNTAPTMM